ncbi:MAG: LysE family translocator [Deltaproteobacteria bacterium]|nr:LysE family translocator [Deltaproteobacteria bacterium]MBW2395737.1 LysE family translocator [Deltaproteobacteria bacterium]
MPFETWLAFCATELLLCFTPGPAVLLVVSVSLARGAGGGLGAGLGILTANAFYFVLSALGIGAAIVASHELFQAIQWAGAAYLIYLGTRAIFFRRRSGAQREETAHSGRAFSRGFIVQSANPKSLVFFTALLPQFLDPERALGTQVAVLGVSSVVIEMLALGVYAFAASRARGFASGRWVDRIQRIGGGFLLAAGLRLAIVSRSD